MARSVRMPTTYVKGQITKYVNGAMGLGQGTLARASRQDVQRHFNPHAKHRYPSNMSGDATRIAREYYDRWGHIEWMRQKLLKDPNLARIVLKNAEARQEFLEAIESASQERAKKGYYEEWHNLGPKDLAVLMTDVKIEPDQELPDPIKANLHNAKFVIREARKRLQRGRSIVIGDWGTGGGWTIVPVIKALSMKERSRVTVALFDIMQKGLANTRQKLIELGLDGSGQILTIEGNFADLEKNPDFKQLKDKVDIAVSGAAIHHTSDVTPTFRGINLALKRGGKFIGWDWGHPARSAPTLIVAPKGALVRAYGRYYELGRRVIEAPRGAAFISRGAIKGITAGRVPTEMAAVRQMDATWMRILKFPDEVERYGAHFDRLANAHGENEPSEPITLTDYLKGLEGKETERGAFKFLEGHRLPSLYHKAMKEAGLIGPRIRVHTTYPIKKNSLLFHMTVTKR